MRISRPSITSEAIIDGAIVDADVASDAAIAATKIAGTAVAASIFDANSILKADSDDTPSALAVAASTIVGRKATGGIAALTGAEAAGLLSGIAPSAVTGTAVVDADARLLPDTLAAPITNGDFSQWTRGTSFATPASAVLTRTAPRWGIYSGADGRTGGRVVAGAATDGTSHRWAHRFQRDSGNTSASAVAVVHSMLTADSVPFAGRQATLSFYGRKGANLSAPFEATVTQGTGTDQAYIAGYTGPTVLVDAQTVALTTGLARYSVTFTPTAACNELAFYLGWTPAGTAGAGDWVDLCGAQLDFGATALPYRPVAEARTAGECLRFVEQWGPYGDYNVFGPLLPRNGGSAYGPWRYARKRAAPTITFSADNDFSVVHGDDVVVSTTSVSAGNITVDGFAPTFNVAGGLTVGHALEGTNNQDTANAYVLIEADL